MTSSTDSTSLSLVQRAKDHDPESWRRLTELYGPMVFQWARRHGLEANDAADIVQDVFATLARSLDSFRSDSPGRTFRGWLWTITRNKVRDLCRDRRNQPTAVGGSDILRRISQFPDEPPDPDTDAAERAQLGEVFHRALEAVRCEFEDRTWRAFWQVTIEGRSTAEVALEMGISANGVRQAKSRVLRRLRDELADLRDDLPRL